MAKITEFEKNIRELLEAKKYKELKEIISTINPYDLATLFENLSEKNITLLFRFYRRIWQRKHLLRWILIIRKH